MGDARENAIREIADLLNGTGCSWCVPRDSIAYDLGTARRLLDQLGLVAVDRSIIERLNSADPSVRVDARHELAAAAEEQLTPQTTSNPRP